MLAGQIVLSVISLQPTSPLLNPYAAPLKIQILAMETVGIMVRRHYRKNAHLPQRRLNSEPCTGMDKHKLTAMFKGLSYY